ncbi:MAG: DeoR/GlpR family DNA-binding transcription regulator [Clostridia bacterium]|nr:DeoR/GlpR family DNA-binding transcription regulator [Clostridia bacterium]
MFVIERQQEILNILKQEKSVTVSDLSKRFFVSEATIRRDLRELEKLDLLKKTYGGAVLLEGLNLEAPLSFRETEQKAEKEKMGKLASDLVKDGDILIIDSSSTTLKIVDYLNDKDKLTVITNGAKTVVELGKLTNVKTYSTGGLIRENSMSLIGETARKCIQKYHADILFFSCRSISMEKGITDSSEEEAELRRIMLLNSNKSVLICDHTKFDAASFCKVCDFEHVDCLVTDKKPSNAWMEFLKSKNIEVVFE